MELAMAGRRTTEKAFEDRWASLLTDMIKENTAISKQALEEARGAHEQAKHTNGRVTKAEGDIKNLQKIIGKKRAPLPPNVLYAIAASIFLVLSMVAAYFFNIHIPGVN